MPASGTQGGAACQADNRAPAPVCLFAVKCHGFPFACKPPRGGLCVDRTGQTSLESGPDCNTPPAARTSCRRRPSAMRFDYEGVGTVELRSIKLPWQAARIFNDIFHQPLGSISRVL